MGDKSFYDLDYIIELNEKRLESYQANYQKTQEKIGTLMIFIFDYRNFCSANNRLTFS